MRLSKLFTKTRKDAPRDETSKNAQLLIRAGYIHKDMAGVYTYLPLGLKVLNNIMQIIREEMDAIGGQEMFMTALQRKEVWEKTDRWSDEIVDDWFKTSLKNGQELGLGFTHDEPLMDLLRQHVNSHRDLPFYPYQFQTKFRNELRAKSGIMRTREFIMKDLYSLSSSDAEHDEFYKACKQAYVKIFDRLGIGDRTHIVLASGGTFSPFSHEFQTECAAGEDTIFHVPNSDNYFNREVAPSKASVFDNSDEAEESLKEVEGKGIIGVQALAKHLNIPVEKTTKTILFEDENGRVIAAAVRGDYDINEHKLKQVSGAQKLKLASEETVKKVTGAEIGYAGILNLPENVTVFLDDSMKGRKNFEVGANKTDHHSINVNFGRDVPEPEEFFDIKTAKEGDTHPESGHEYEVFKAAEVGNIFSMGSDYTSKMGLTFVDEGGSERPVIWGGYGIGPGRTMGVIVETLADEKGLVWPENISPAAVHIITLTDDEKVRKNGDELYQQLTESGVEALYDDRDASAGVKFGDADLIGVPKQLIVSPKTLEQDSVELRDRRSGDSQLIRLDDVKQHLAQSY